MDRNGHMQQAAGAEHWGVQPAVSTQELDRFDTSEAAARIARLEADSTLMLRLSVEGYDGKTWQEVYKALIDYGFPVMRSWIVTGLVFTKLAEKGHGVPAPPRGQVPRDDAIELAYDTVADAVVNFRDKVLKAGRWDPSKGANLTTFFVGNCLLQFTNLYRDWRKQNVQNIATLTIDNSPPGTDHPALQLPAHSDPEAEVVNADQSRRNTAEILQPVRSVDTKAILMMRAENFGIDEIAETLGLPYKAVESQLYRARKKLRTKKGT